MKTFRIYVSMLAVSTAIAGDPPDLISARMEYIARLEAIKKDMVLKTNTASIASVQSELDKITKPFFALSSLCHADKSDRATEVANLFESYFLNSVPDFRVIDRRATDAHFRVIEDRNIPMPDGRMLHDKHWLIPSQGAPAVMLQCMCLTNDPEHTSGGGVFAPDLNDEAMSSVLSKLSELKAPSRHLKKPDGTELTYWSPVFYNGIPTKDFSVMLTCKQPDMSGTSILITPQTRQ